MIRDFKIKLKTQSSRILEQNDLNTLFSESPANDMSYTELLHWAKVLGVKDLDLNMRRMLYNQIQYCERGITRYGGKNE